MKTENHWIESRFDLDLAMIEGTSVRALCGVTFIPTVTPGTSGKASVPGAQMCPGCEAERDQRIRWNRLRDERNRINREMYALSRDRLALRRRVLESEVQLLESEVQR